MALDVIAALLAIALVLSLALAAPLVAVRPRRRANALLAVLLVLSGTSTFLYGEWGAFTANPAVVAYNVLASAAITLVYVVLLAEVLDTPLVAPFRRRGALAVLVAVSVATLVPFALTFPRLLAAEGGLDVDAAYEAMFPTLGLGLLGTLYGLVASVSAWRRAPLGSPARARAGHFALAFGVRDGVVALAIATTIVPVPGPEWIGGAFYPVAIIASVPLLAYGILKAQIFDIDLRIKAGVRRGTVLAAFLLAFGALAIAVERATTAALGVAAGGAGVALLLFALVPLQRFAARVADRLLPGVRADEEYVARRKLEVYRAAVEDTLARNPASVETDAVLADLRRSLGVTREQHEILVLALGPRAPAPALAGFEILEELGRGGFGRALLARDRALGRLVVLKEPLGLATPASRELFLREARIAAQIHHPNVVGVHQVIAERDPPVIVLEHVDGESLADRLAREGPLPPRAAAALGLDVLAGLARIHAAGIVHRDLKPANVLLARDGLAKITDFGIAHAPPALAARALTRTGFHPGSPAYMSPEQARGERVDARSDLYSVGLVLHEALTGRTPGVPPDATAAGPRLPARAAPPPAFASAIARALDPDPAKRYGSADEMAAALREALVAA